MKHFLLIAATYLALTCSTHGRDIRIIGKVVNAENSPVAGAVVSIGDNSGGFTATTQADGTYSMFLTGITAPDMESFVTGLPFPIPFRYNTRIPFKTGKAGDIEFSVYDLSGKILTTSRFRDVMPGSYTLNWDGRNQNGSPLTNGLFIYALTFNGKTISGRLVKTGDESAGSGTTIEPYLWPDAGDPDSQTGNRIPVVASASRTGFHTTRFTDISIANDTVINFTLIPKELLPFKTTGDHIAVKSGNEYLSLILKGINLGSSPPGYFPGEIAYAITPQMYEEWISMMAEAGFNSLRVYTLHPPVFYEKLAEHNMRNPDKPLYLFQGIWLDEPEDGSAAENNLLLRSSAFKESIREVIDCMHGNKSISFRPGRAYGVYYTDISPWVAGYIAGREISPHEVMTTNQVSPGAADWDGNFFTITGGSMSERFVAEMLDEVTHYEHSVYGMRRTVSMSSWPTLDPLTHPTEIFTDEDIASIDITKMAQQPATTILFASYHAYPYYPDFVSDQPEYRTYSDEAGPNSYVGYLTDLRNHYAGIPLIIGEFGVPSSWGDAHSSFSGMNHGGLSEIQQGEYNIRLLRNIINTGCGGGFMFAWMDEWFKQTWIVNYMEAFATDISGTAVPTRQLWHNLVSPEQNFGLITFDPPGTPAMNPYSLINPSGITAITSGHENNYFWLEITTSEPSAAGDTVMVAFDTYLEDTGEGRFPSGATIPNRSEFLLIAAYGADTASLHITEAYDMFGLTPRFNLTDETVQKFRSTSTDGAPWKLMRWINNGFDGTIFNLGLLPSETSATFTSGERTAVAWSGNKIKIRLPWTLLHFYDPTQMRVIDGAESFDGGYNFTIYNRLSDGIAISVLYDGLVTHTANRYTWPLWLTTPQTSGRAKKSLEIVTQGLHYIPNFAN